MNLLEEIRTGFANLSENGCMLQMQLLPACSPAWIFRDSDLYGVAVPCDPESTVCERFAGASLGTEQRIVNGEPHHLLRLGSSDEALRNEFAVVCAQMVDPGIDGGARRSLIASPLSWWDRWRQLLGNAVINQSAYSVLGELLVMETLLQRGEHADWRGAELGSVDIDTPAAGFEVKSTVSRYESRVHISGQFQLAGFDGRKLHLIHQRFEPVASGDSVTTVLERLVAAGVSRDRMEVLLTRCGLQNGCAARREGFRLIESKIYEVDENFPRITNQSFVGGVVPAGIVRVEYQIDLAGLVSVIFQTATSPELILNAGA